MTLNHSIISEATLNATATSVDIAIPSGYTDVKLVMSFRAVSSNTNYDPIGIKINGSTPNGSYKSLGGTGSASQTYGSSNETFTASTAGGTWLRITNSGIQPGGSAADLFSNSEMYISNYSSSSTKNYSFDCANEANGSTAYTEFTGGTIATTSAITSISFALRDGSFAAGSSFTLYGIAKLGVTPTQTPKASGGDIIKNDGTYWYHAFTSTGSFIPQQSLSADVLVVAGGGAGGAGSGGGGGAGGLIYSASSSFAATSYTATIGAGGAGGYSTLRANPGTNSSISSFTAIGGGGGGNRLGGAGEGNGGNGGSGGGGATDGYNGGTGTSGQGNAGGNSPGGQNPGGGGGGAGAVGQLGGSGNPSGGDGGVGLAYNAFGAATLTGQLSGGNYYYAGGGGGSYNTSGTGEGGLGGGGSNGAANNTSGVSGTVNTGGGGGASTSNSPYQGGSGGSGIVIIRYAMA